MHTPVGKLTEHQEMYLKAIFVLSKSKTVARVKDISRYLGVTKSSVSSALKMLAEKGLIEYEAYSFASLTPKGKSLAVELLNKFDALSDFLTNVLAVPSDVAEENACRLEHVVDDFVMERLIQFLTFVRKAHFTFQFDKPGTGAKVMSTPAPATGKAAAPRKLAAPRAVAPPGKAPSPAPAPRKAPARKPPARAASPRPRAARA